MSVTRSRFVGIVLPAAALPFLFLTVGCDQLSTVAHQLGVTRVEARTADDGIAAFETYQEALVGRSPEAVIEVFGKPKGVFERRTGKTWMYPRWCVEFDSKDRVVRLERDIASNGSRDGSGETPRVLASAPTLGVTTPAAAGSGVKRISNGGQTVELSSITMPGKITIVDFYADWCGPCRQISPQLEKLASEIPNAVLVKVDIVKWGTPVTKQYGINSVPNIRVYDASGELVGNPTHSLSEVQANLAKAGH